MSEIRQRQLPSSWTWTRLGEIADINPRMDYSNLDPNLLVTFVPMAGVNEHSGTIVSPQIMSLEEARKGHTKFQENDVIFARITPCMENGKTTITRNLKNGLGFGSTEFHVFRPKDGILPEFIYYFIRQESFRNFASRHMTSTVGQRRVAREVLEDANFPLAPVEEQKRITSKIIQLFSQSKVATESIDGILAMMKNFRQAVLDTACNGRLTASWRNNLGMKSSEQVLKGWENERRRSYEDDGHELAIAGRLPAMEFRSINKGTPDSWIGMTLESGCTFIIDCPHSTPKFTREGQYCIDTTCVEPSRILWSKARKVSDDDFKKRTARMMPRENDILFSREGTIGTVVRVPPNAKICLGQRIMMFRFAPFISAGFAELLMQSTRVIDQYRSLILGTSSPHLNIRDIRKLTIFVPGIEEQREIVTRTDVILELVNHIEERCKMAKKQADYLPQAILSKAFCGELVSQDANDEPASVLLERINTHSKTNRQTSKQLTTFHDNVNNRP